MFATALAHRNRKGLQAARLCAAVSPAIEPLESRVMFASGDLDTTFGAGSGFATHNFYSRNDFGFSVAVQADQKLVVAGWVTTGTSTGNDVAVLRYNTDGSLDTTFGGGDGIVITHLGSTADTAFSVAVQGDGKIVVGGQARGATTLNDFAVVRYLSDGSLDTSFGAGGIVKTDLGSAANDTMAAMTLMADGKIVLVGSTVSNFENQMAAVRYNADGTLDTSFGGGDGIVVVGYGNGTSQARSVAMLSDGSLVLGGTLMDWNWLNSNMAAVHLMADGSLDTAFGNGGWAYVDLGGDSEMATGVMVTSDGRVVLAGQSMQASGMDFGVARLMANGLLDSSFGTGGMVLTDFGAGDDAGVAALTQPDGKVLVVGNAFVDGSNRLGLVRYNADGSLDASFGAAGMVSIAIGIDARGKGVALDGSSRILVVGNAHNSANFDFVVARLQNQVNQLPTAHAGGPYMVLSGSSVNLDGSGSSDPDGVLASYEWDFNYDGVSFDLDATGAAPSFSGTGFTGVRTVALRVTDAEGASHLVTTTVTVLVAPVAHAGGPYTVNAGGSLVLDGSLSSDADGSLVSYEWDFNYDGSSFDVDASGMTPSFVSDGLSGVYTVALRVTDNDGLVHVVTTTVTVNVPPPPPPSGPAVLVDDPNQPGKKMLVVNSTNRSDRIRFRTGRKGTEVRIGRTSAGVFSGMSRIVVFGGGGNDTIDASNATVPVALFGGDGNDRLVGTKFSDILVGGDGNDGLDGGRGDDLMVGGAGRDLLLSRHGNDLMVAGSLTVGDDLTALDDLLSAWVQSAVTSKKGAPRASSVATSMVIDDGAVDTLYGTPGVDAMHMGPNDRLVKLSR